MNERNLHLTIGDKIGLLSIVLTGIIILLTILYRPRRVRLIVLDCTSQSSTFDDGSSQVALTIRVASVGRRLRLSQVYLCSFHQQMPDMESSWTTAMHGVYALWPSVPRLHSRRPRGLISHSPLAAPDPRAQLYASVDMPVAVPHTTGRTEGVEVCRWADPPETPCLTPAVLIRRAFCCPRYRTKATRRVISAEHHPNLIRLQIRALAAGGRWTAGAFFVGNA